MYSYLCIFGIPVLQLIDAGIASTRSVHTVRKETVVTSTNHHSIVWGQDSYLLQISQALVHSQTISQGSGSRLSNSIPFKTVEESTPELVQVVKIN